MNLKDLESKLNKVSYTLKTDNSIQSISHNIKNNKNADIITQIKAKQEYYSYLPKHERIYQEKNDKYKGLINCYSKSYLEMAEFYVGPELPREHYLQSKKDIQELYLLFGLYALAEPYINAYHDKYL